MRKFKEARDFFRFSNATCVTLTTCNCHDYGNYRKCFSVTYTSIRYNRVIISYNSLYYLLYIRNLFYAKIKSKIQASECYKKILRIGATNRGITDICMQRDFLATYRHSLGRIFRRCFRQAFIRNESRK